MNNEYSLIYVLKILARWKKQILIATGAVALISVVGALMMPNYYQSSTILYPASPTLANPDPIGGGEKSFFTYGTGEDLDRLFSIANSGEVKRYIIGKFDLAKHYDIDTSSAKGQAKLIEKFSKLYATTKTKFDGLQITVEDTDPTKARDMVREARVKIETIARGLIKESQRLGIKALEEGITNQETMLAISGDSLRILKGKYKIYESDSQAEEYAAQMASNESRLAEKEAILSSMLKYNVRRDSINKTRVQIAGLKSKMTKLDSMVKVFNMGVLPIRLMEVSQNKGVVEIALERERLKKLQSSYNTAFTTVHVVEKESIPYEKSRPKRSLIVVGLTMLAFLLSCLGVLLIDATRDVKWREIYAGK